MKKGVGSGSGIIGQRYGFGDVIQGVTHIYILDRHKELKGFFPVFWFRIRDPGWKKIEIQDLGSGINLPDLSFENFVSVFWVKNT
jgi:hypothetical protein